MPRRLSEFEVKQYHEQGYCSPVTVMSPAEATGYLERLDRAVAAQWEEAWPVLRMKSHLVFGCLNELVHLPAILDAVEDVLGPVTASASSTEAPAQVILLTKFMVFPPPIVSVIIGIGPCTNGHES